MEVDNPIDFLGRAVGGHGLLDVLLWDVSNRTDMVEVFQQASVSHWVKDHFGFFSNYHGILLS
jgi:hypothetical protein